MTEDHGVPGSTPGIPMFKTPCGFEYPLFVFFQKVYKINSIRLIMTEKGVAYILGIVSLVLAFFQPLPAVIIAIVGLVQNRKEKNKTAKMLNIIALIVGIIMLAVVIAISVYGLLGTSGSFPVY